MSIVDLDGKEIKSAASEEETREAALKAFQEQLDKLDEERFPLDDQSPIEDVFLRMQCLKMAMEATYPQVEVEWVKEKGKDVPRIRKVNQMPMFAPQQIALLSERMFSLVVKL